MVVPEPLLNESTAHRAIWNNSTFREQIPAPPAAGPQPFLIQSEDVRVRRERAALADFPQDIDAGGELAGELVEHVAEGRIAMSCERCVRAFAKLNVIVDVDEAAIQAVGEEAGDEQGQVANFAQAIPLAAAAGLQRTGEANAERLFAACCGSIEVDEPGEKVHQVERREVTHGDVLMFHRRFDELLEVLRWRLVPKKHLGHVPFIGATLALDECARAIPSVSRDFGRIIM